MHPTTQLSLARQGLLSPELRHVAGLERVPPDVVRQEVARGRMVVPANRHHAALEPAAIGIAARVKVNVDLAGADADADAGMLAQHWGADTITVANVALVSQLSAPVATAPIRSTGPDLSARRLLRVIDDHARQGVDCMTIHAGMRLDHLRLCERRVAGVVSRGGGLLARWMVDHAAENPLFERFDDVLAICAAYDVTLSLGAGLRPGAVADAGDAAQLAELDTIGELIARAWARGVQVMVEGPGHMPLDQLRATLRRQREVCREAPFYADTPLVTDVALGYDHIASAIGGATAGWFGASLLRAVTRRHHVGRRTVGDLEQSVVVARMAAHAADLARGDPHALARERRLAFAREGQPGGSVSAGEPERTRTVMPQGAPDLG